MRQDYLSVACDNHIHFNGGHTGIKGKQKARNGVLGTQTPAAPVTLNIEFRKVDG